MTIVGQMPGGFLVSRISQAGPGTPGPVYNPAARPTIVFTDFSQAIEAVLSISIEALPGDGGAYVAHDAGFTGRTLTVMVTGEDASDVNGAVHRELQFADSIDLANKNFVAVAIGR